MLEMYARIHTREHYENFFSYHHSLVLIEIHAGNSRSKCTLEYYENSSHASRSNTGTKLKTKKNLVIISKLKIGDKIAFNKKSGLLKLHTPSLGTKMTRTFTRESRWTGLNKVQQTLNDALSIVEEGEETNRSEIEVIESVLTEALGTGLENLKSTYESDESVAAYVSKIQRISLARLSRAHDLRWGEMRKSMSKN